jgi:chaperonin GroES
LNSSAKKSLQNFFEALGTKNSELSSIHIYEHPRLCKFSQSLSIKISSLQLLNSSKWFVASLSYRRKPSSIYQVINMCCACHNPLFQNNLLIRLYHQTTALKSIKSLAPLLDRVLVQRIKAEARTAGGIFLPESSVKELNEAKVLAVGPGGFDKDGKRIAMGVKAGDKVLIPQVGCAAPFCLGGEWEE